MSTLFFDEKPGTTRRAFVVSKSMKLFALLSTLLTGTLLAACSGGTPEYSPKPKGYPRLDLPATRYQPLTEPHPYRFEYSAHARVRPDTFRGAEPHWIFIDYPQFGANVQLTYKDVRNDPKRLAAFISDAHKLAAKHQIKAYSIQDLRLKTPRGYNASLTEIAGEVPSQLQFYTTDSTRHFLRGALYFQTATQNDSLAPVIDYLKKDIVHLLNTLEWRK